MPRNDPRHGWRLAHRRVTAATVYEAVAQGLAAIRGNEWVAGIAQGLNVVKDVRVEHEVKLGDFTKWLEKAAGRYITA